MTNPRRDNQGVLQPVHQQEIALLLHKGGLQLGQPPGEKLADTLQNFHQLRGDTYTVSYSWKICSTVPSCSSWLRAWFTWSTRSLPLAKARA